MYCSGCGAEILPNAAVCLKCGRSVSAMKTAQADTPSAGWWFLGFFVPMAGLILWLVWKDSLPKKAKQLGIGALVGVLTSIVLVILFYVLWFALVFFSLMI